MSSLSYYTPIFRYIRTIYTYCRTVRGNSRGLLPPTRRSQKSLRHLGWLVVPRITSSRLHVGWKPNCGCFRDRNTSRGRCQFPAVLLAGGRQMRTTCCSTSGEGRRRSRRRSWTSPSRLRCSRRGQRSHHVELRRLSTTRAVRTDTISRDSIYGNLSLPCKLWPFRKYHGEAEMAGGRMGRQNKMAKSSRGWRTICTSQPKTGCLQIGSIGTASWRPGRKRICFIAVGKPVAK